MHSRHRSLLRITDDYDTVVPIPKEEKNDTTQHVIGIHLYESKAAIFSQQGLVAMLFEPQGSADCLMVSRYLIPQYSSDNRFRTLICFSFSVIVLSFTNERSTQWNNTRRGNLGSLHALLHNGWNSVLYV